MKLNISNRIFWLLLIIMAIVIFWYPIQKLLPILFQLEIKNFHDVFSQPSEIRQNLKEFATVGILMTLLLSAIIAALLIHIFNCNKMWCKKLVLSIFSILMISSMGPFFNQHQKNKYFEITSLAQYQVPGKLLSEVQFLQLNPKFKNYLELASQNKLKCYIQTHLIHFEDNHPITINDTIKSYDREPIALEADFIKKFIQNPILKIETNLSTLEQLVCRDLNNSISSERTDLIFVNNKPIMTKNNKNNLLIYFKFVKPNGEPLAVFL